jgi:hypothetical protein
MKKEILKEAIKAVLLGEKWDKAGADPKKNRLDNKPVSVRISDVGERVYLVTYYDLITADNILKKFKPIENKGLLNIIVRNNRVPRDVKSIKDIPNNIWTKDTSFEIFYEIKEKGFKEVIAMYCYKGGNLTCERYFKEDGDLDLQFVADNFFGKSSRKFIKLI